MTLSTHEHLAVNTAANLYWQESTRCRHAMATGALTHDVVYSHTDETGKTTKISEDALTHLLEMWKSQPREGSARKVHSTGNVNNSKHPVAMISFKYLRPVEGGWEKVKVKELIYIDFDRQHRISEVDMTVTAVSIDLNLEETCQKLREAAFMGDKATLAKLLSPELQLKITDPTDTRELRGYYALADAEGNFPVDEGSKHTWSTEGMEVSCHYKFCSITAEGKKQHYKVTEVYTCAVEKGRLQVTGIHTDVVENNNWFF